MTDQEDNDIEVDMSIDLFKNIDRALGYECAGAFDRIELEGMHKYILFNCDASDSYLEYM